MQQAASPSSGQRNNIADIYPLSPMQEGILFHTVSAPQDGLYMPQTAMRMLELLIEAGVLGCGACGAVWLILYRRADPAVRWLAIMMATYAFTENNLDNFTVMSLFVLFFVSAGTGSAPGSPAAVRSEFPPAQRATPGP